MKRYKDNFLNILSNSLLLIAIIFLCYKNDFMTRQGKYTDPVVL